MSNELEEAIKKLNRFKKIKILYGNRFVMLSEDLEELQLVIEIVLKELKKPQEENEDLKLEKRSRMLGIYGEMEVHEVINKTLQEDYIAKDKIREKIEELNKEYKVALKENSIKAFILKCQIEILEELLEGK